MDSRCDVGQMEVDGGQVLEVGTMLTCYTRDLSTAEVGRLSCLGGPLEPDSFPVPDRRIT